jgi:MbtH protein
MPPDAGHRRSVNQAVINPFDDENGTFLVLLNDECQYSLWPAFVDVPEGWKMVYGQGARQECLGYIESNWRDMRPKSLRDASSDTSAPVSL